jgi:hypothetical protein
MLLKDSKNGAGRLAGLELGGERMCKEIVFRAGLVRFQGIIDY